MLSEGGFNSRRGLIAWLEQIYRLVTMDVFKRPDDQPASQKRPALALDFETILAINTYLENLGTDIDNLHGRISLDIVKGKFQRIEVTSSYLLINKKKRQTA